MSKFLKRNVRAIFIMLGNNCNLRCRYCMQHCGEMKELPRKINPDIYDFIREVSEDQEEDKPVLIQFFGGEPTLYFKEIKEIVDHTMYMNVTYSIITNGKAITEEMVDFFNDHGFHVCISWDGFNVKNTRGYDAFSVNKKNLFKINDLGISSVLTSQAYPKELIAAHKKINDEYHAYSGNNISTNIDLVFDTGSVDPELLKVDYGRIRKETHEIAKKQIQSLSDDSIEGNAIFGGYLMRAVGHFKNNLTADDTVIARCGNGINVYNMDLAGNLYGCHNEFDPVGTIYTPYTRYLIEVLKKDHTSRKTGCNDCIALPFCKKGCKLITDKKKHDNYCKINTAFYGGIADALIEYGNELEE